MDMQLLLESLVSLPLHLLPGLVLLRRRDRSGAVVCLGLAALLVLRGVELAGGAAAGIISLLSILFTLLWAAAVVLAGRVAAFRPLKKGSPLPVLCRVLGPSHCLAVACSSSATAPCSASCSRAGHHRI